MATTKLTKINLQKADTGRVKGGAAPEGGVTDDQNPAAGEGEETMEVPPPSGAVGGSDPSQTSAITDPMELRQTNTNKLQRIKADETTTAMSHGREEGTDTVRLKVVREKKKQLPDVVSPGQTVHLRPSAAPDAAGGQDRSASSTIKAASPAAAATPTGVLKIISKPKAAPRGGKLVDDDSDKAVTRTLRIQPGQGVAAAPPMEAPRVSPEADTAPALAPTAEKVGPNTDTKARAEMSLDEAAADETVASAQPLAGLGTESKKLALRKAGGAPAPELKPTGTPLRASSSGRVPLRPTPVPAASSPTDETMETSAAEPEADAEGVSTTQSTVVATPAEVDGKTGKLSMKLKRGPESAGATVAAPSTDSEPATEVGQATQVEPSAKRTVAVAAPPAGGASETIQIPPEEAEAAAAGAGEKKKIGLRLKTAKKETAAEPAADGAAAPAAEAATSPARRAAAVAAATKSELGIVSFITAAAAVLSLGALTAVLVKQVLDHCM